MLSTNRLAKLTGVGYLIIFITGFYSNFFVLESLITPGNAAHTINKILNNEFFFRSGILGFIIMVIADLFLAWTLYLLLKSVNGHLSLLAAWFRLVNVAIFGIALYKLLDVLPIISRPNLSLDLQNQVMMSLQSFNSIWLIGLVFFGFHLLILGYLVYKFELIPKLIGILLFIAGIGYLIDSTANFMLSDYDNYKDIFSTIVLLPGIVGELSFTIWLLVKNFRKQL